jgi:AraC-like DNA-binding protein
MRAHGTGDFTYWRAPALPGIEFAEGRGPVVTTEAPHFHAEGQMVLLLAGRRLVERDGAAHCLEAGELLWVAPGAVHTSRAVDGVAGGQAHFLHAYLPPGLLPRLSVEPPATRQRLDQGARRRSGALLDALRQEQDQDRALAALTALFGLTGGDGAVASDDPEADDPVARARAYLDRHFDGPVTLEDVAAAAGLSRFQLVRAFARRFGLTPHAWLLRRRVNHAKALLRAGAAPAEAALASGFADQSHMGLHFRRLVGLTPAAYRRA